MKDKLKPCPFCGGKAGTTTTKTLVSMGNTDGFRMATGYKMTYGASCENCGIEMQGYPTKKERNKAWNRRAK